MATSIERHGSASNSAYYTGAGRRRTGLFAALAVVLFIGLVSIIAWQANSGGSDATASAGSFDSTESEPPGQTEPAKENASDPQPETPPDGDMVIEDLSTEGKTDDEVKERAAAQLITITAVPETAEIFIDDKKVATGYYEVRLELSADVERRVAVRAQGYRSVEETFSAKPPSRVFRLNPKQRRPNRPRDPIAVKPDKPDEKKPKPPDPGKPRPRTRTRGGKGHVPTTAIRSSADLQRAVVASRRPRSGVGAKQAANREAKARGRAVRARRHPLRRRSLRAGGEAFRRGLQARAAPRVSLQPRQYLRADGQVQRGGPTTSGGTSRARSPRTWSRSRSGIKRPRGGRRGQATRARARQGGEGQQGRRRRRRRRRRCRR